MTIQRPSLRSFLGLLEAGSSVQEAMKRLENGEPDRDHVGKVILFPGGQTRQRSRLNPEGRTAQPGGEAGALSGRFRQNPTEYWTRDG